ncbi:MAG: zinc ribbon domain-containing protein [Candidatus Dadabacteria bacterium]|nr:zinc ribbon domain-containing protein [Candidatus Dadabacteria bacterium]NIS09228.1 zinc ribbon domain-containing protein [Candidatus Dadabacteria bacterium]NIV42512.1 hypothetical protein [Candidatus Dadabacteria bacterium]NIY22504.1 hypothetical protein [Candidatus Dadabacteria bacterium]
MSSILEKLSNLFSLGQPSDPTELSDKLAQSISSNLNDGEQLVHCIRNHRAFHNAKSFNKKNMFFNSICILTDRRLIIIRNLDYFKLFREINLAAVRNHRIEKSVDDLVINLNTGPTEEDIIEFSKHALSFAEEFSKVFEQTLIAAKEKYPVSTNGIPQKKCGGCGKLVDQGSKFCHECGHKLS